MLQSIKTFFIQPEHRVYEVYQGLYPDKHPCPSCDEFLILKSSLLYHHKIKHTIYDEHIQIIPINLRNYITEDYFNK